MKRLLFGMTALALSGSLVFAGAPSVAAEPSPRDTAEALIKQAHAEDLFTGTTAGQMAAATHTKSGIVCLFLPVDINTLSVDPTDGRPRGDDFTCSTDTGGTSLTVFGTRYGAEMPMEKHMARVTADLSKMLAQAAFVSLPGMSGKYPLARLTVAGLYKGKLFHGQVAAVQASGWTMTFLCLATPDQDEFCTKTVASLTVTELRSMMAAENASKKAGG